METETEQKITRKNIRLREYDYAQNGYYFITICTKDRECILSKIERNCRGVHCTSVIINNNNLYKECSLEFR